MKYKSSDGFTLIELLIVIAIIGILSGLVVAVMNPAKQRARAQDGVLISTISRLGTTIDTFYAVKGRFPDTLPTCNGSTCELYDEILNESHWWVNNDVTYPYLEFRMANASTGGPYAFTYWDNDYGSGSTYSAGRSCISATSNEKPSVKYAWISRNNSEAIYSGQVYACDLSKCSGYSTDWWGYYGCLAAGGKWGSCPPSSNICVPVTD